METAGGALKLGPGRKLEIKFTGYRDGTWERDYALCGLLSSGEGFSYVKALLIHGSGLSTSLSIRAVTRLVLKHTNPIQPGQDPPVSEAGVAYLVLAAVSTVPCPFMMDGIMYLSMLALLGPSAHKVPR